MFYDNLKFGVILSDVFSQPKFESEQYENTLGLIETFDTRHYDSIWVGSRQQVKEDPQNIPVSFIMDSLNRTKNIELGLILTPSKRLDLQIKIILDLLERKEDRLHFCILLNADSSLSDAQNLIEALLLRIKNNRILIGSETSPIAAKIAGYYGLGLFTAAATTPGGQNALTSIWEVYTRHLKNSGHDVVRKNWTIAGPMHIANTRKNAINQTRERSNNLLNFAVTAGNSTLERQVNLNHSITIGSPKDAIKQIKNLQQSSGGFGTFLFHHHGLADVDSTLKSYQIISEKVAKHFQK